VAAQQRFLFRRFERNGIHDGFGWVKREALKGGNRRQ
jgi:hypothetical protein